MESDSSRGDIVSSFPSALRSNLIAFNKYEHQTLNKRHEVDSGAPVFRRFQTSGYRRFSLSWSFSETELRLFSYWYRETIALGSLSFDIEIRQDDDLLYLNSANFVESPIKTRNGDRWRVDAILVSSTSVKKSEVRDPVIYFTDRAVITV